MIIEHRSDEYSKETGATTMRDITTIQEALVAAHIADLQREAAALRAERDRDHLREHAAARADSSDHVAALLSRRGRTGARPTPVARGGPRPPRAAAGPAPAGPPTAT